MRKRTPWMLALMTAILVLCMAEKAACETFSYNGDPHQPFPDAWGDADVDCGDPDASLESDCWKCEGPKSTEPIPKFQWILTRECPTFSMSNTVQSRCYCVLAGSRMTDSVAAGYEAEDGHKFLESSMDGCGGNPPEEEPITLDIQWDWATSGLATVPASGTGSTATFDYTVPKGQFSIDVSFSAKAVPIDTKCNEIAAGPEVVGKITGAGYAARDIPSVCTPYPPPTEVPSLQHNGNDDWGQLIPHISGNLNCEPLCSTTDCKQYRVGGQFSFNADILILPCLPVLADNCSLKKGECKPLSQYEKDDAILHERKHFDMICQFVDEWNEDIENDSTVFDSCAGINAYIQAIIYPAFQYALSQLLQRQADHCPDFANEILYGKDQCGDRIPVRRRICP